MAKAVAKFAGHQVDHAVNQVKTHEVEVQTDWSYADIASHREDGGLPMELEPSSDETNEDYFANRTDKWWNHLTFIRTAKSTLYLLQELLDTIHDDDAREKKLIGYLDDLWASLHVDVDVETYEHLEQTIQSHMHAE